MAVSVALETEHGINFNAFTQIVTEKAEATAIKPTRHYVLSFILLALTVSNLEAGDGYPSRAADLDALPGFKEPPPGYGQVPFWWWSGEELDTDRMVWQVRELHEKGISGVQVNYSHFDSPGWVTDNQYQKIFSDQWWDIYSRISEECGKLDMGIGLSTYTIDWPKGQPNLFTQLFYSKPELNAISLESGRPVLFEGGQRRTVTISEDVFAIRAYRIAGDILEKGGVDLTDQAADGAMTWEAPEGKWQVWMFGAARNSGTFNPLAKGSGQIIIDGFYQRFQDNNPGRTSKGLNYFFNDELKVGAKGVAWNSDFPEEFERRKGYDLMEVLPALWGDMGDITPKVRIDYADVRMSLMEQRYFKPIYDWHQSRGMIFGCDNHGRGKNPAAYGDYFRACRWYTAPGHDTPGRSADLIKGKVSSSIANLYQRPRVWQEAYHSLGWGAKTEDLMLITRKNYLYGCTLLNLHGLYYSTYGSHWEWAPPSYHFRMPYWEHMDVFFNYFDRLSYLLSQGHHVCDVAVIYPVTPYEAKLKTSGDSTSVSFDMGAKLMTAGINFDFLDHESLARAVVKNGRLTIPEAETSYKTLVFPSMEAVRWKSISKAAEFAEGGGQVIAVGQLPRMSDRAGVNDSELDKLVESSFEPECRLQSTEQAVNLISKSYVHDVRGLNRTVQAMHRRVGPREVYMVMDSEPGDHVAFRAKGAVELWDPWTGDTKPLKAVKETATGTVVELLLESYEAQIVVFTPGQKHVQPAASVVEYGSEKELAGDWSVSFIPTMNNTWGDFRLPVTADNKTIGVEARRFDWSRGENTTAQPIKQLHGYGAQFYVLGPISNDIDLDKEFSSLTKVDPTEPVQVSGQKVYWQPYEISWQYGKEGDHGHQGYHGLKGTVTDDFICLGEQLSNKGRFREFAYQDPEGGSRYYLWTSATVSNALHAEILASQGPPADGSHTSQVIHPAAVYVNGRHIQDLNRAVALKTGANPVLVRYDNAGRGHFVIRRKDQPMPKEKEKLAMRWFNDPGVIPFDIHPGDTSPEWFRFVSAPGTQAIKVNALGKVQEVTINGTPMTNQGGGRFEVANPVIDAAEVVLKITPETGRTGGAVIPDPIVIETGTGAMPLGDWSEVGVLNNYSGGVKYEKNIALTAGEAKAGAQIDLGQVIATAEVHVNGKKAGVRVAPPWKLDVTGLLVEGDNTIEITVYNTISNHYQTIPSNYKGSPVSGLMGPVRLRFEQ